jgi:putative N-acetyltransferase (TIGR04045 family)
MDASMVSAGCARCQACSAISSLQTLLQIPTSNATSWNATYVSRDVDEPVDARGDRSSDVVCVEARTDDQRAMHYQIRHAVFVDEQAIFTGSDIDERDARDDVVRVLALDRGRPVGAVRLYPVDEDSGLWQGDRLAVLADCRSVGAGAPLVRFAVAYARAHHGRRTIAHIQLANVRFFERLGWSADRGVEEYLGQMHQPMSIALSDF